MQRTGRKMAFKKKALPMPTKKVDYAQNKRIVTIEKKLNKLDREIESKFVDLSINAAMVSNPAVGTNILLLNGLAPGTSASQRIGEDVRITSMQFRGYIQRAVTELGIQKARLIIVFDKQTNGAGPAALSDLLTNVGNIPNQPYNKGNVPGRFKILYDKEFALNPQVWFTYVVATGVVTEYAPMIVNIKKHIQINQKADYGAGNAGTVADITKGSIYAYLLSTENSGGTPPTCTMTTRVFYRDA